MTTRARVLTLIALVAIVLDARADYQSSYRNGVLAYQKNRFQDAVTALSEAVAEKPAESKAQVLLYGVVYEQYLPHYYLGMAYSKLGRCPDAVRELTESQRQNVVPKRFAKDIDGVLARCASTQPSPAPVTPREEPVQQKPEPQPPKPEPQPLRPEPQPPTPEPQSPGSKPVPAPVPADQRLPELRKSLTATLQKSRKVLASAGGAGASESLLLRNRIKMAESLLTSQSPDEIASITRDLSEATRDVETWLRLRGSDVPSDLVAGVEAYLRGDYSASVTALKAAAYGDERLLAQAMLFRAASLHALYIIGHSKDKDLLAQAARDVQQFKRLQRNRYVDGRVFNPMFIQFVEQSGS